MTNSEHNDLEKLLKDNLSDKAAFVPDFVWDKIEEEIYPEKKRRGFFWLFFLGLGLIAGAGTVYFTTGKQTEKPQLAKVREHQGESISQTPGKKGSSQRESAVSNADSSAETIAKTEKGKYLPAISIVSGETGTGNSSVSSGTRAGKASSGQQASGALASAGSKGQTGKRPQNGRLGSGKILAAAAGSGNDHSKTTLSEPKAPEDLQTEILVSTDPAQAPITAKPTVPDSSSAANQADSTHSEAANAAEPDNPDPVKKEAFRRFAINVNGGASLYDMAVFKDYFTSGQLSNRTFKSSGFEIGAGLSYQITRKFGIYTQVAFNCKQTQFNYNLAITESDYFNHLLPGELLPIENIIDNGIGNCFLAKDVKAGYRVDSWLLSLGGTYQVLSWKKFTLGADVRFSANLSSALTLDELTVLKIRPYRTERFNYLKTGAGLNLDYHFNNRISLGVSPMFYLQLSAGKQSFYAGKVKELVLPVNFKVNL